jgi:ribosomal protein L40E
MCRGCYAHNAYYAHSTDVRCRACGKDLGPEFARRLRKDGAWVWGVAGGFVGFLAAAAAGAAWVPQAPVWVVVPFVALGWTVAYSAALPGD